MLIIQGYKLASMIFCWLVFTATCSLHNHQVESLSIAPIESTTKVPILVFDITKLQLPIQFHGASPIHLRNPKACGIQITKPDYKQLADE